MKVTERIHALKIPFTLSIAPGVTLDRFVYVFLIYGQKKIYLIDTGVASSEGLIFEYLRKTGRNPDEISLIVQTHSHPDHIGATRAIKQVTGCAVAIHAAEKSWLEDVDLQFRERPVPGFHTLVGGSVTVDRLLTEGEPLELETGLTLEVFHTPGHSQGSVSLLLREDQALFSGDAVLLPGDLQIYEDFPATLNSIRKLKAIDGINFLLAAWDDPRPGNLVDQLMEDSLKHLQLIHQKVIQAAALHPSSDPMALCREVVADLGLPPSAATPMLAKSFQANLKAGI
jgi:hydroxyacylglutathione hydrolase